jgi:2,3-bisphosphoglycerate-independent phosphoglycerate mutase
LDERKYVLIVPDGAGDVQRRHGRTPMAEAETPWSDWVASQGVCGLMQTLYPDLPRGSIVAQLGMLGWDPYQFSCLGRSAWELLALDHIDLSASDLVFRANFVQMEGKRLKSYNAGFIESGAARRLVARIEHEIGRNFQGIELHHSSDFRNSLVVRGAALSPALFDCPEPHESEGTEFDLRRLVAGRDPASRMLANRVNCYLVNAVEVLRGEQANALFAWSPALPLSLAGFHENTGFAGRAAIVGCVDFLQGIARAAGIDFYRTGNGRPHTDYAAKGARTVELLRQGYSFVFCHVNGPDEAAHMRERGLKIYCLEQIDSHIVRPVVEYFDQHPGELGGVMLAPDHFTNLLTDDARRVDSHSLHPVPFALWNGVERDQVSAFHEDEARGGKYGASPIHHLELLSLLGVARRSLVPRQIAV